MNKATCEKLVDAYGLAVELYAENERRDTKSEVDIGELCDNLRDVIAELSSDVRYHPVYVNAPSWKPDTKPTWTGDRTTWGVKTVPLSNDRDYEGVTRPMAEVRA